MNMENDSEDNLNEAPFGTPQPDTPPEKPKDGKKEEVKEAVKQKVGDVLKKAAKKAATRAAMYLASPAVWPVVVVILIIIILLIVAAFLIFRSNIQSPGSQTISPKNNPQAQADIQAIKNMKPNAEFNKKNNLARVVASPADIARVLNSADNATDTSDCVVDARVIHLIRVLAEKFDHIKYVIRDGHDTEATKYTDEADPGSENTISAHYFCQAVDIYEVGLISKNGWKETLTVPVSWQKINADNLADEIAASTQEILGPLKDSNSALFKDYNTGQNLLNDIKQSVNKAKDQVRTSKTAWDEALNSIKNAGSNDNELMGALSQINDSIYTLSSKIAYKSCGGALSIYGDISNICPQALNQKPSEYDIMPILIQNSASFLDQYNSYIQDYKNSPQAKGAILSSIDQFSGAYSQFLDALNNADTISIQDLSQTMIALNQATIDSSRNLESIADANKSAAGNALSTLEDLNKLNDLEKWAKEVRKDADEINSKGPNDSRLRDWLDKGKTDSEQLTLTLASIRTLDNLEILQLSGPISSREYKALDNLKYLDKLQALSYLDGLDVKSSNPDFNKDVEEIKGNITEGLAALGSLSKLGILSSIEYQYGVQNSCPVVDTTPQAEDEEGGDVPDCGLSNLYGLYKLQDAGREYPLKNLSNIGQQLAYLGDLKQFSDPALFAYQTGNLDLSGLSVDNLSALPRELSKINAVEGEISDSDIRQNIFDSLGINLPENLKIEDLNAVLQSQIDIEARVREGTSAYFDSNLWQQQLGQKLGINIPANIDIESMERDLRSQVEQNMESSLGINLPETMDITELKAQLESAVAEVVENNLPAELSAKGVSVPSSFSAESLKEWADDMKNKIEAEMSYRLGVESPVPVDLTSIRQQFEAEVQQKLGVDIPLSSMDAEKIRREVESQAKKRAADLARKNKYVRAWDNHLTDIAPVTIYRPNAQNNIRNMIEFAYNMEEPWKPRQILAITRVGQYDLNNPNYGSILSNILVDRVHFGY